MQKIFNITKNNLIELLFSILGTEIIYASIYRGINIFYFGLIILANIIEFYFYNFVLEKKEKGPRIYIPVAGVVLLIAMCIINTNQLQSDISYSTWIFNGGHLLSNSILYELSTLILISLVFSSMFFYFSVKIYRSIILLLLVFMVIIIHMKCIYNQNNYLVYSFIILFIFTIMKHSSYRDEENNMRDNINKKHVFLAGSFFIPILILIAIVIPKPQNIIDIPLLDSLKNYFNVNINTIESGGFNVELNQSRKVDESTKENSDTVIFELKGSNPDYLISHIYDNYENNEWSFSDKELYLGQNISRDQINTDLDFTLNNIQKSTLSDIKSAQRDYDINQLTYLRSNNVAIYQVPHPSKTIRCQIEDSNEDLFIDGYNSILNRKVTYFPVENKYKINYIKSPQSGTQQNLIMKYFNRQRYEDFLNEVCDKNTMQNILFEMDNETEPFLSIDSSISSRVRKLSKKLTRDSVSNYDKAKDIENYLKNGDFTYDLDIGEYSSNDYLEYFIFNSKKGYCVQFATAMTIMCREIGIPARYAEGYMVSEKEFNKNKYEVKESYAHSFVEVYIPGYGWEVFDPTPSKTDENNIFIGDDSDMQVKVNIFITYKKYIIYMILIGIMIALLLYLSRRRRKINKILRKSNEKALEMLIRDSILMLNKIGINPDISETEMNFCMRLYDKYNITLLEVMKVYYESRYAGKKITKSDVYKAVYENKKIYKFAKEYKKAKVVR